MVSVAKFVNFIVERGLWGESDFLLADVGVSGGVSSEWNVFGERLRAIGFDPLIAEVQRLTAQEVRPHVRYEAAFVGWDRFDEVFPPEERSDVVRSRHIQPYYRSSACKAHELRQQNYVQDVFNAGAPVAYADRSITLDAFFADGPPPDFIKVDTDGFDYAVLLGARDLLQRHVLGLHVELQFHGAVHDYGNTFANIDRYLRALGYSLFEMKPVRYSRAALPAPFEYDIPAQTLTGQIGFTDGIYLRDLAHPQYRQMFDFPSSREQALKTCCLFVLFGLPDCAAELIVQHPDLQGLAERDQLLDMLTPTTFGRLSYGEYVARFNSDPMLFLPSRMPQAPAPAPGPASVVLPADARPLPSVTLASIVERPQWEPAKVIRTDKAVKVVTAKTPWSFSAEIEFDHTMLQEDAPCFLRLRYKVKQGSVGLCVVSPDGQLVDEVFLKPRPDYTVVVLRIESPGKLPRVIVRNTESADEPSVVTIRGVELLQSTAVPPRTEASS